MFTTYGVSWRRRGLRALLLVGCVGLLAGTAARVSFHDFWIAPAQFRVAAGATVPVALLVGHLGGGKPYARNPAHLRTFVVVTSDGRRDVPGRAGAAPAGAVTLTRPGVTVLGYESHASLTTLPAARFEAYLREEGLEHVVRLRSERGEHDRPGREAFVRCAKALVEVGGRGDTGHDRLLGFPLELVSERSPYTLGRGGVLPVRLLLHGQPLAGARVVAVSAAAPGAAISARTDAAGRVRLRLPHAGVWLVKCVYMRPSERALADWESFWASLTFELPP